MSFETHCHTRYSGTSLPYDGLEEPADIVRQAKKLGLSGVAVTDHDTTRGWKEARREAKKQGIIFIPGMEVSTRYGHVVALGISESIPAGMSVIETVERIHGSGGVAIAAHPYDIRGRGIRDRFVETDAAEGFNSLNLDRFSNHIAKSRITEAGMPMVSGTDAHTLDMVGRASIGAEAHDVDSLIKAIRKGRIRMQERYISLNEIKEWNRLRMISAYMEVVRFIDHKYRRPSAWLLKQLMSRFVFSKSMVWDVLARMGLAGAIGYGAVRMLASY